MRKLSTISFPDDSLHVLVELPGGESFSSRPGHDIIEIVPSLMIPCIVCCDNLLIIYHSLHSLPYHPPLTLILSVWFVLWPLIYPSSQLSWQQLLSTSDSMNIDQGNGEWFKGLLPLVICRPTDTYMLSPSPYSCSWTWQWVIQLKVWLWHHWSCYRCCSYSHLAPPKPSGANGISELVIHPEYNTQVLSKHKATVKQLGLDGRCGLGAWHPMLWEDYARNADGWACCRGQRDENHNNCCVGLLRYRTHCSPHNYLYSYPEHVN